MPEADQTPHMRVLEKNFQARQAECQHWSPRSQGSQSTATGVAIDRVFNTEEQPLSKGTATGRLPAALDSEKDLENV